MTRDKHNGVSRVLMIYREENLDAAAAAFAAALGIDTFEPAITPPGFGLRFIIAWDAGFELIAPHGSDGFSTQARAYLDTRGEGLFGIVYRVADLEAAETCATAAGYPRDGDRIDCFTANPEWAKRFSLAMEAPLPPIAGISVTLIQFDPKT